MNIQHGTINERTLTGMPLLGDIMESCGLVCLVRNTLTHPTNISLG